MNDPSLPDPMPVVKSSAAATPRGRRVVKPQLRKSATAGSESDDTVREAVLETREAEMSGVWPEAEVGVGHAGLAEHPKRKRRRKKGKGNSTTHMVLPGEPEVSLVPGAEPAVVAAQVPAQPAPVSNAPHLKLDPALLTERAWKIYLAEVSEEGVALISDSDAKELARRCCRLAEIFMEEQTRRH